MRYIAVSASLVLAVLMQSNSASAFSNLNTAQIFRVQTDIRSLEAAIENFMVETGEYPATAEGLAVLFSPMPSNLELGPQGRYETDLITDPWGNEYQYAYPGIMNPNGFDVWTYGADGAPGGDGNAGDFGNWPGSFDEIMAQLQKEDRWRNIVFGTLFGFCIGLPIYVFGVVRSYRAGASAKGTIFGLHFAILAYLVCFLPFCAFILWSLSG